LVAGAAPVVVGSAVAWHDGAFSALLATAALVGALLIQIGTNLANDYYDHIKGADTPDRLGAPRASASGAIPPRRVRNAAFLTFALAGVVGLYLTMVAGWVLLAIGAASIVFGLFYTAGPRPLGYLGLGDLLVFVFFGPVAVVGTHFVQSGVWSAAALVASVPVGALATMILVVNNLRDIGTDRAAGKHTLAVRIGPTATKIQYGLLALLVYSQASIVAYHGTAWDPLWLPMATLPMAVPLVHAVATEPDPRGLNRHLAGTARLLGAFALLASIGWIL
jgi:1,4-dihydroxy-2-naphthoate octaprenyltransferase